MSTVCADPVQIELGLDNRYSDNVTRSDTNEQSDLETRVNVGVRHYAEPGQCMSDLSADLGYGMYLDDTYDPENYITLDWFGNCEITDRLYWDVSNSTRDVIQDSRSAATPDNTTRRNIFRTGPRYTLRLSPRHYIDLAAEYENEQYESSDEPDSEGVSGTVAWRHLFSQTLTGGLRFTASDKELDTDEDITTETASAFFNKVFSTTQVSGSIGATRLETEVDGDVLVSEGITGDIRIDREITATAWSYLEASRRITDDTSDYDFEFDGVTYGIEQRTAVEITSFRVGLRKQFGDTSNLDTSLVADRSDEVATGIREDRVAVEALYRRPITGFLDFTAGSQLAYLSYTDDNSEDQLFNVDVGLSYQWARDLSLRGEIGHNRRASDIGSREYVENWILVGIEYQVR
ncbi:porin family protein [Marinobacter fonticola]|uniref:outer membrane beta-barrel protein n=1 Tax=Marinobacter fonticola TaxID=2603215 RepID=UPI00143D1EE9|nr:outer membrane beta-barrel protein [Marinobacter fonticola]